MMIGATRRQNTSAWEQRKLGDCGSAYGGLSSKTKEDFGHGAAKFVPYTNVFDNPITDSNRLESIEKDSKQNEVRYGDALFTVSSETPEEVGMSSVWLSDQPNVYLNSFCFGYRQDGSFDSRYLAYMLRSQGVRSDLTLLAQGISRFNISKNKVMELEVPYPGLKEQARLGSFFERLDSLITLHQRKCSLVILRGAVTDMLCDNRCAYIGVSAWWEAFAVVFDKESDFEEALIGVLKQHGWDDAGGVLKYPTEADLIDNWADILFRNNSDIDRLNGCPLTKSEMHQVVEQVETLKTPLALNSFINGKTVTIKRDNPADTLHNGKEVSLKIYDRKEIAAGQSRYQIAQQPVYAAKSEMLNSRRGDICLLINGMPLIHIELKKSGIPVSQACNQIEKYAHEGIFSGIFRLVQIFVAMNPDDAVYFANPGSGRFNPSFYFHWADFNNEPFAANANPGGDDWKRFTSQLLSIPMAHQLIGFYTVADSADGVLKVLRSYQYYAASAISDRVKKCHWNDSVPSGVAGRPGGYVWHTTGSGKTMTSFKSAQLVADSKDADKVVFLMDRIELGTQSLKEYRSFADNADDVQGTDDTAELRSKLKSADPKDTLIVTSIQKMSRVKAGEAGVTQGELDRMAAKRVVFILDECHRSTFGDMLHDIRASFPNALYFGFTGTPIQKENQKQGGATTSMVFGDCLHRYSIADGIRDGNVLGFDPYMVTTYDDNDVREQVALGQAKAATVAEAISNPAKSKVFYYWMQEAPMGPMVDASGESVKGVEDFLSNAQYGRDSAHPKQVVADIVRQFPILSRGNKFHAMLATSSIVEAVHYYRLLKAEAPQLKCTALFDPSIDNNGGLALDKEDALVEIIGDYNAAYGKDFAIPTWANMKKDIAARLSHKSSYANVDAKREERLDLLIVVDQMLTGFDSKWVNTLYLDKVIDYENIIQAFSRTNRLFDKSEKPFGTIRYYRKPHTMKGYIDAAVKLYSGDKPLDLFVQKLPENIALMDARWVEIRSLFEANGVSDLSCLPELKEARRKFAKLFVELNEFLAAAKVQGFDWREGPYSVKGESGEDCLVEALIDERTYLILVQRYKELFEGRAGANEPADVPYDLDGHITEIDTGRIDADYMNANFVKWLKALHEGIGDLEAASAELHRSFASLSQEEQRLAELFLHDVERGDAELGEGMTLRDHITAYAARAKNSQAQKLVEALGVDAGLLGELMALDVSETSINEFGRFDRLKASVDKEKAKDYFERREGKSLPQYKANMKAAELLKRFVLEGGFPIDE